MNGTFKLVYSKRDKGRKMLKLSHILIYKAQHEFQVFDQFLILRLTSSLINNLSFKDYKINLYPNWA